MTGLMICENAETYGWNTISDIDLLTIAVGNRKDAQVLKEYFDDSKCSVDGLLSLNIDGIGKEDAVKITAFHTLFRRERQKPTDSILSSMDLYNHVKEIFRGLDHEEFWVVYLDTSSHPLKKVLHSSGGMVGTVVDTKMILKKALEIKNCSAVAIAHNHPSGSVKPSAVDKVTTKRLKDGCDYIGLKLIEHIIVSDFGYYSFFDESEL